MTISKFVKPTLFVMLCGVSGIQVKASQMIPTSGGSDVIDTVMAARSLNKEAKPVESEGVITSRTVTITENSEGPALHQETTEVIDAKNLPTSEAISNDIPESKTTVTSEVLPTSTTTGDTRVVTTSTPPASKLSLKEIRNALKSHNTALFRGFVLGQLLYELNYFGLLSKLKKRTPSLLNNKSAWITAGSLVALTAIISSLVKVNHEGTKVLLATIIKKFMKTTTVAMIEWLKDNATGLVLGALMMPVGYKAQDLIHKLGKKVSVWIAERRARAAAVRKQAVITVVAHQ
jgi:hypothetical protein